MLKIQENTVASIKAVASRAEKKLTAFVDFIQKFHNGEAWKFGNVPGYEYSLSEVSVDSLKVLRTIKSWPVNRVGLSSQNSTEQILNALNGMESNIDALSGVQDRLSNEIRPLEFLSFFFQTKINNEEVVNLSNYTVNLFGSLEAVKQSISSFSFYKKFEGGSGEELVLLSDLLASVKATREAISEVRSEASDGAQQIEGLLQKAEEGRQQDAARSAELVTSLEERLARAETLLGELEARQEEVDAVKVEASNAGATIGDILGESKSSIEEIREFSNEVFGLNSKIESVLSRADEGYARQKEYIEKVEALIERAESMVSGATVAGLAQAFSDERKSLEKNMKWAMGSFIVGIIFIFLVTILLGAYVFEIPLTVGGIKLSGPGSTPALGDEITIAGVLSRTIILLAPFWLTLFSARRYRNLFDLRQQYSHKYNMAFSVDGFKQQAPAYQEQIAAWVFHVVAEAPVTNAKKPGRGMDESPMLALQEIAKLPHEKFDELLKAVRGVSKGGD